LSLKSKSFSNGDELKLTTNMNPDFRCNWIKSPRLVAKINQDENDNHALGLTIKTKWLITWLCVD